MKQNEIKLNHSYLFKSTVKTHKKDMIDTVVTVVAKKQGKTKPNFQGGMLTGYGKSTIRYLLSNGRYAAACELKLIEST
jgi:hypothetical protein